MRSWDGRAKLPNWPDKASRGADPGPHFRWNRGDLPRGIEFCGICRSAQGRSASAEGSRGSRGSRDAVSSLFDAVEARQKRQHELCLFARGTAQQEHLPAIPRRSGRISNCPCLSPPPPCPPGFSLASQNQVPPLTDSYCVRIPFSIHPGVALGIFQRGGCEEVRPSRSRPRRLSAISKCCVPMLGPLHFGSPEPATSTQALLSILVPNLWLPQCNADSWSFLLGPVRSSHSTCWPER